MIVIIVSLAWLCSIVYTAILGNYALQHPQFNYSIYAIGAWLSDCLSIILICTFVPSSKKYVGLSCILICLVFFVFKYLNGGYGIVTVLHVLITTTGLSAGFFLSYLLFKNNGWGLSEKTDNVAA
jgi:hypothetical protein